MHVADTLKWTDDLPPWCAARMLSLLDDERHRLELEDLRDEGVRRVAASLLLRSARLLEPRGLGAAVRVPMHVGDLASLQPAITAAMHLVPALELIVRGIPKNADESGAFRMLAQNYPGRVWAHATKTLLRAIGRAQVVGVVVPSELLVGVCNGTELHLLEKFASLSRDQGSALLLEAPPAGAALGPLAPWLLQTSDVEVTWELAHRLVS